MVKSKEEYKAKVRRDYRAKPGKPGSGRYGTKHFKFHDRNEVYDPILHRFLADLKERLYDS